MFGQYGTSMVSSSKHLASSSSSGVWVNGKQSPFGISIFDTIIQSINGGSKTTKYYDTCVHYHRTRILCKEGKGQQQKPVAVFLEPWSSNHHQNVFSLGRACDNPSMGSTPCPTTIIPTTIKSSKFVSLAVCGLIFSQENKLFLTRRPSYMRSFPSAWVFPGGSFDEETDTCLEDAISREVYEETGIQTTNGWKLESLWESVFPTVATPNVPIKRHHLVLYFSTKLNESSNDIKLKLCDTEVDAATWLSPENIHSILSNRIYSKEQHTNDDVDRVKCKDQIDDIIDIIMNNSSSTKKESLDQLIGIYPRLSFGVNEKSNNNMTSPPSGLAQGSLFALEEYWYSNDNVRL